jgi:hypothetical protein
MVQPFRAAGAHALIGMLIEPGDVAGVEQLAAAETRHLIHCGTGRLASGCHGWTPFGKRLTRHRH